MSTLYIQYLAMLKVKRMMGEQDLVVEVYNTLDGEGVKGNHGAELLLLAVQALSTPVPSLKGRWEEVVGGGIQSSILRVVGHTHSFMQSRAHLFYFCLALHEAWVQKVKKNT